jgi:hypothetical protein
MIGKLASLAVPPWAWLVGAGLIVAIMFGSGFKLCDKLHDGEIARLEARIAAEMTKVQERDRQLVIRDRSLREIRETLEAAERARDEADARYFEEVNKPPRIVERVVEAEAEVPDAVHGETCVDQVASAIEHLKSALADGGT